MKMTARAICRHLEGDGANGDVCNDVCKDVWRRVRLQFAARQLDAYLSTMSQYGEPWWLWYSAVPLWKLDRIKLESRLWIQCCYSIAR